MKNIIRKGKTKRPIHIRVLAVVMALVMVLSVIYINHREDRVKADAEPQSVSYTEDDFLGSEIDVAEDAAEPYIVNVPAKGVKFKLPGKASREKEEGKSGDEIEIYKRTIPAEGENPETVDYKKENDFGYNEENPKPDNVTIEKIKIQAYSKTTAKWTGDDVDEEGYITASAATTATLEVTETITGYKCGDDDYTAIADNLGFPSGDKTPEKPVKITIKPYVPGDITANVDNAAKSAKFADASYPTDGINYGEVIYSLQKDGADDGSESTIGAINDRIIAFDDYSGDGDYTVTRTVKVGTTEIGTAESETLTRNFYVIKGCSANVASSFSGGVLTIPDVGKANPTEAITVTINTDANASLTITDPTDGPGSSDKNDGSTENTFTIAGSKDNNAKSPSYTVVVKDANDSTVSEEITVNIIYGDGTPTLEEETYMVNGETSGRLDEVKYAKSADATISAKFSCTEDSGALISSGELFKVSKTAISTTGLTHEAIQNVGAISGTFDFPVTLSPGENYYMIKGSSNYGKELDTGKYSIFYDDKAPVISGNISVKQAAHSSYGGSVTPGGTAVTIPNKITCLEDATISIPKSSFTDKQSNDTEGSGVDKVTFKRGDSEDVVELVDNAYSVNIPADDTKSGTSETIEVTAKDKAGNISDTYSIVISYFDETIYVDSDITPEKTSDNYFKWDDPNTPVAKISYTISSEVEIPAGNAEISDGSNTNTVSLTGGYNDSSKKYEYTYVYNYPIVDKKDIEIVLSLINANGKSETETTEIRHIDITKPTVTVAEDTLNSERGEKDGSKQWYHKLVLIATVDDGTISSGIESITAEGTEKSDYTNDLTDAGIFVAVVNESEDKNGTNVKFVVTDKAHNKPGEYSGIWYVDKTNPAVTFTVGDKTDDAIKNHVFKEEPTVSYSVSDKPSELAGYTVTLSDGATSKDCTDASFNNKKVSDILGTAVSDTATYTLKIEATDKSGLKTNKETSFRIDIEDPEVKVEIVSPENAAKSEYSRIYKENVKLKFTASDATILSDNQFTVTDSEKHEVSPTWNKESDGSWTGTAEVSVEGSYKITFTAKDSGGNSKSDNVSFIIDKTKPDITTLVNAKVYDNPNDFFDNTATVTLQIKDTNEDEKDVTTTIKRTAFDGTETTETKSGKGPFICSSEGRYVITTKAVDKAGNENTKTIGFTVDKTNPEPKIDIITKPLKIEGYFNQSSVELAFEIDDPTVLERDITVTDNGNKVTVSWTFKDGKATAKYNATTEGEHSVTVAVKDQADNEAKTTKTFVIDRTKPKLTTKVNSKEYNSKDDYFPGNVTSNVVVKDDNEDKKDITTTIEYDSFSGNYSEEEKKGKGPFTFKKQGKYKITYKAVDKAGNEKTKVVGFYIDKTNPVGNMYIKTDKPPKFSKFGASYINKVKKFKQRKDQEAYAYGQYYNTNVTIEFNYFDYGMDSVTITDGDEEIIPDWTEDDGYGKGTAKITDEGHHVIKMTIEDKAGNTVSYKSGTKILDFYIDKTPPVVSASVNGSASGDVVSTNGSGSVSVSVEDANKDPDDITMTVSSSGAGGGSSKVSEGSQSFSGEADYDVQFTAVDKAGNSSSPASAKFRVDHTAPELDITSNATNGASKKDVEVTFSIKETFYNDLASSKIDVYRKVDGDTEKHYKTINFTPRGTSDSMTETFKEDGEYRCVFSARDRAGNDASKSYTFILDGSKPIITLSGVANYDKTDKSVELGVQVDETFYLTNKVKLDGTKTDIEGKTESIDFGKFPSDSAKISELSKMFKEDGIYDITVSSTDKAGNTDTKTLHFTIDKTAPVIDDLSAYDGKNVSSFDLEKPLEELVKDLTVCEIKMYMDGNLYDGTGALSDGSHVLRIEATDEMGHTSTKEVTFVLDTIAPNIIITGAEDGAVLKDATKVTVSVELDGDFLDYVKVNGKAYAVSGNECQIDIDKRGRYTLEAAASDGAGNKSSTEIHFSYGRGLLWMIIGGVVILIGLLAGFLALLGKRKKESNE